MMIKIRGCNEGRAIIAVQHPGHCGIRLKTDEKKTKRLYIPLSELVAVKKPTKELRRTVLVLCSSVKSYSHRFCVALNIFPYIF